MAKQSDIILHTSSFYISARTAERLVGIARISTLLAIGFLMGIDLNQLM